VLATHAAAEGQRAHVPGQLRVRRHTGVFHRRYPDAVGQREALRGHVFDYIYTHAQLQAFGTEQVAAGPRSTEALLLRGNFGLVEDAFTLRRGGFHHLSIRAVLGDVAHGLVGPVGVSGEDAAEQIAVAV